LLLAKNKYLFKDIVFMAGVLGRRKPVRKRHLKTHEKFNSAIHNERRSGKERRSPWQRTDPNDRRSGQDRRQAPKGVKAAHVFYVKPKKK